MKLLVWTFAICASLAIVGAQDGFQDGAQDELQDVAQNGAPKQLDGDFAKQIGEELTRREEIQGKDEETGSDTQLQDGEDVIAKRNEEFRRY